MRFALGLEYDGSGFCGWQSQPSGCSLQDALERALSQIAGHPVQALAAGRTDAGVHATAQVVHFDSAAARPASAWIRGTNTYLPPGMSALWVQPVAPEFHARFAVLSRTYHYVLLNHGVRPALTRAKAGWYHRPLDLEAMRAAAQHLIGEHDFSSFRGAECQAHSPLRRIIAIDMQRYHSYLVFRFHANGFLHHMVRNIMGCLIRVGNGSETAHWLAQVLQARDRSMGADTFAPDGLYLTHIEYPAQWNLPQAQIGAGASLLEHLLGNRT